MSKTLNINLKICGITSSDSIVTAAQNDIRSLGFASNNLHGPNTCDDKLIKKLISELEVVKSKNVDIKSKIRLNSSLKLEDQAKYVGNFG